MATPPLQPLKNGADGIALTTLARFELAHTDYLSESAALTAYTIVSHFEYIKDHLRH